MEAPNKWSHCVAVDWLLCSSDDVLRLSSFWRSADDKCLAQLLSEKIRAVAVLVVVLGLSRI